MRLLIVAIVILCTACSDPIEQAIVEYEERTPSGSIDRNIVVMDYEAMGEVMKADSINHLETMLKGSEKDAKAVYAKTKITFDNEFTGTPYQPTYERLQELRKDPEGILYRKVKATWEGDNIVRSRVTLTKTYAFHPEKDSVLYHIK